MASYRWRSLSKSLSEGSTDGKYRKDRPNTESIAINDAPTLGDKATLNPLDGYSDGRTSTRWKPDGTRA